MASLTLACQRKVQIQQFVSMQTWRFKRGLGFSRAQQEETFRKERRRLAGGVLRRLAERAFCGSAHGSDIFTVNFGMRD